MKFAFLSRLFGAKTRDAGFLAVSLTERGIGLAQFALSGDKPRVVRCSYQTVSSLSDEALAHVKSEAGLTNELCTTVLAPGEYQMLLVEAPVVPESELKTALRWKIKDSLAYPADEATIDVLKIPANKSRDDQRPQSLYALAASNQLIQKRMALFEQAELLLRVIDIPETAQRNIAALFEQQDRALAVLVFDETGGLLTFTAGGELYLSRRIEITAGQLSDASESLREQYRDRVELELQRSLDYFDRQFSYLSLSRVLLCAPEETGLQALLDSAVGVPVENLDLTQVMDISEVPALADSQFAAMLLPVLGAALRQTVQS